MPVAPPPPSRRPTSPVRATPSRHQSIRVVDINAAPDTDLAPPVALPSSSRRLVSPVRATSPRHPPPRRTPSRVSLDRAPSPPPFTTRSGAVASPPRTLSSLSDRSIVQVTSMSDFSRSKRDVIDEDLYATTTHAREANEMRKEDAAASANRTGSTTPQLSPPPISHVQQQQPLPDLFRERMPFSPTTFVVETLHELLDANYLFYDVLRQEVDTERRNQFDGALLSSIFLYLRQQVPSNVPLAVTDVWVQVRPGLMQTVLLSYTAGQPSVPSIADCRWPLRVRIVVNCHPKDELDVQRHLSFIPCSTFNSALHLLQLWFGRSMDASQVKQVPLAAPETSVGGLPPMMAANARRSSVAASSANNAMDRYNSSAAQHGGTSTRSLSLLQDDDDDGQQYAPQSIYHRIAAETSWKNPTRAETANSTESTRTASPTRRAAPAPTVLPPRRFNSSNQLLAPNKDELQSTTDSVHSRPYHSAPPPPSWEPSASSKGTPRDVGEVGSSSTRVRSSPKRAYRSRRVQMAEPLIESTDSEGDEEDDDDPSHYEVGRRRNKHRMVSRDDDDLVTSPSNRQQPMLYSNKDGTMYFVEVSEIESRRASHRHHSKRH